jgi:hypothetical protein
MVTYMVRQAKIYVGLQLEAKLTPRKMIVQKQLKDKNFIVHSYDPKFEDLVLSEDQILQNINRGSWIMTRV